MAATPATEGPGRPRRPAGRPPAAPARGAAARAEALAGAKARFLGFLERRLGSRADAEDVLQAALVRVLEREAPLRDEERLVPWFYQVLRNLVVDHHRRRAARAAGAARAAALGPAVPDDDLLREACACVGGVLAGLRPAHADLLRRLELAGEPPASAARALGISPGNLAVRLHRARRALRAELGRLCRTCADHGCLDCTCGRPAAGPDPRGGA
jgi:RNA polymerase sigma-70 factor (ECF subfamily)